MISTCGCERSKLKQLEKSIVPSITDSQTQTEVRQDVSVSSDDFSISTPSGLSHLSDPELNISEENLAMAVN